MKIYYAHHLWKYDTNIETWEQNLIAKHFPLCEIVNPNGAIEQGRPGEDIMADCLQMVRACDALVFSSLSGVIGQGVMQEIEEACGLPFTAIVNNSNLGEATTVRDILDSASYANAVAEKTGLPIKMTTVNHHLLQDLPQGNFFPLHLQELYYHIKTEDTLWRN